MQVYAGEGDGGIDLEEALYWILFGNGKLLASTDRDWKETAADIHFTTREIEERAPGSSQRIIFADMANGASYRIDMFRFEKQKSFVFVMKLAPFVKKK